MVGGAVGTGTAEAGEDGPVCCLPVPSLLPFLSRMQMAFVSRLRKSFLRIAIRVQSSEVSCCLFFVCRVKHMVLRITSSFIPG